MSEKDRVNLLAILDAADKILQYTLDISDADAFFEDQKTFDATLMNFVVIGESVNKLSKQIILQHGQVPWAKIKGFRNIVAHEYFGVDAEEVWQIVQTDIPALIVSVNAILEFGRA